MLYEDKNDDDDYDDDDDGTFRLLVHRTLITELLCLVQPDGCLHMLGSRGKKTCGLKPA